MIRPFVFENASDFQHFFNSHPRTDEGLTYVAVGGRGYQVNHGNRSVNPATAIERHQMDRLLQGYGDVRPGSQSEAAQLTALLPPRGGPQVPPPTRQLQAPTIASAQTPQEQHLNELATRTAPVQAYEIGPIWSMFYSPIITNVQINPSLEAETNPQGYNTALNTLSHQAQGLFTMTSGINPQGSMHRAEGFWMATQQLHTRQIIDLQLPPAEGAAAFIMPIYPMHQGEEAHFGCMRIVNIGTEGVQDEMHFAIRNTLTGEETELTVCNFLWDSTDLITPERLYDVACLLRSGGNSIVMSDEGVRRNGVAAIAEILLDRIGNNQITEANRSTVLDDVILGVRQELGPSIVSTPQELQLLENFLTYAIGINAKHPEP